jgi:hypothetical protein
MSAYRRNRSKFDALPDVERVHVRERAQTIAEQRFRDMPGQGEPPRHKPGNTGGTYNSDTPGDTRGSTMANTGGGVELLARVINNRVKGAAAPSGKTKTPTNPPWHPRRPQRQGA